MNSKRKIQHFFHSKLVTFSLSRVMLLFYIIILSRGEDLAREEKAGELLFSLGFAIFLIIQMYARVCVCVCVCVCVLVLYII